MTLVVLDDEPRCRFAYNPNFLTAESIEKIISHFTNLLHSIAETPEIAAARLSILTAEERRKMSVEWNDNGYDYPKNQCIHEFFEAQTTRTPDATALIFSERRNVEVAAENFPKRGAGNYKLLFVLFKMIFFRSLPFVR